MNTDSNSMYYKLRQEGQSDEQARKACSFSYDSGTDQADQMEMRMEHQLHDYLTEQE